MRTIGLTAGVTLFTAAASPGTAAAYYFPEHVAIARDALRTLPPDVRAALQEALDRARTEGLPLCGRVDLGLEDLPKTTLHTSMLRSRTGVDCVPLAALAGLAGDHADGARELREVLSTEKGREITTAAAFQWQLFRETLDRAPKAPVERMSFVHELDVAFYFIDPGYELRAQKARAHFVDAQHPLDVAVRDLGSAGAVDNATAQVLVHHLRSLQLATQQRASEALLEHGFALHFLEDAFAAGHLVMTDRSWASGSSSIRQRHDFFDAAGLRVKRAMAAEPCATLEASLEPGLLPCWTTWGDGHLGVAEDASDRTHVAAAVRALETQLALAFDAARILEGFDALGERERIAFAATLDPAPWWTMPRAARRARPPATSAWARAIVTSAITALEKLRTAAPLPPVDVGAPLAPSLLEPMLAGAVEPCIADTAATTSDDASCGRGRSLALGTIGVSLVRPVLVGLPQAQVDPSLLVGTSASDHGLAFQLLGAASAAALLSDRAPVDVFAPGLGVSMGLAYRFGSYLPGRRNRAAAELNAGITTALHVDSRGEAGGHPLVAMLEQELRWPILWEALTSYVRPLDLPAAQATGSVIALGGVRVHEVLTDPRPRFWGVDFEVIAIALSRGAGAYPLYSVSPEMRLHAGIANAGLLQPGSAGLWAPSLSLTFTGGYATLF